MRIYRFSMIAQPLAYIVCCTSDVPVIELISYRVRRLFSAQLGVCFRMNQYCHWNVCLALVKWTGLLGKAAGLQLLRKKCAQDRKRCLAANSRTF
ncbi:hypothetical protein [Sporolactobacillus pectinivorans]|uniref:hypothetical protein n=1 Tax=Sporolactobacillus pectinivorans TaxID=1591408 RepID=UPI000C25A566|nr:hypothetical protein [Sporolactobacillus pectinivorans]